MYSRVPAPARTLRAGDGSRSGDVAGCPLSLLPLRPVEMFMQKFKRADAVNGVRAGEPFDLRAVAKAPFSLPRMGRLSNPPDCLLKFTTRSPAERASLACSPSAVANRPTSLTTATATCKQVKRAGNLAHRKTTRQIFRPAINRVPCYRLARNRSRNAIII